MKSALKWLARVLLLDVAIAFAVPLFEHLFDPKLPLAGLIWQYFYSIIYTSLIAIPLCIVLPPLWLRTENKAPLSRASMRSFVVLVANLAGCLAAGGILRSIIGPKYQYWQDFRRSLGISLVLSAVTIAFLYLYEAQQESLRRSAIELQSKELERERALKLASEARLSALEARIHPHFLFNTLNSVSALIHDDPARAEKIVTQLAELLRFSLDAGAVSLVPLSRELYILTNYLEIERARFGVRLHYTIDVPSALTDAQVPPLAVQTLVENSVKYAVSPHGRGASIGVRGRRTLDSLRLEVEDDGPGFKSLELPVGHGLNNLNERLNGLFGDKAKLDICSSPKGTTVAVEIPLLGVCRVESPSEEVAASR